MPLGSGCVFIFNFLSNSLFVSRTLRSLEEMEKMYSDALSKEQVQIMVTSCPT